MHSSNLGIQAKFTALSVALTLVTLWLLLYGYHGVTEDGQIYAFQAYARLHSQLTADLYLQYTSQDQFTLFSPLYAWFIGLLGLENAARLLTLVFTVWFFAATWYFAGAIAGRGTAWLAVAFLLIVAGNYGAYGVFRVLDPFLTARLPAEAMIITALGCHIRGMKRLALLLALGAGLIHPLIALPGLLLLVCLWLPVRASVAGAIGCVVATLALAVIAARTATVSNLLAVMDTPWTDVVRERSQFLFLQQWSFHDWALNVRPFIYLGFTAIVLPDERMRKLCAAAALVGAAGLAVAIIGSLIGPVAILVQGQAWRWVWISVFVGAALLPFVALKVWRDDPCGPCCALLLVAGWTLSAVYGTVCVSLAVILWVCRAQVSTARSRWACVALGAGIVAWFYIRSWAGLQLPASGHTLSGVLELRNATVLKLPAALLVALLWWVIRAKRMTWVFATVPILLAAASMLILPAATNATGTLANAADILDFADWENVISPTSTVLVVPPRDAGAFVWFTLRRPNYLALNQSAGVVFSRATALEVRRRSEVLRPLMDPDWKILTRLRAMSAGEPKSESAVRPLTPEILRRVCADPQLGFVVSRRNVGFHPLRHEHIGIWKDWSLYDCREMRSTPSAT
jgi:hypothetical protein